LSPSQKGMTDFFKPTKEVQSQVKKEPREEQITNNKEVQSHVKKEPKEEKITPSKEVQSIVKNEPKKDKKIPDAKGKLFAGLVAHFAMEKDSSKLKEQFSQHGGSCTTEPRKANLVFYNTTEAMNLEKLR